MKRPGILTVLKWVAAIFMCCVMISCKNSKSGSEGLVIYVGTYGNSLYRFIFEENTETVVPLGQANAVNPSYLALGAENAKDGIYDVYAVSENGDSSAVMSFADDISMTSTGKCGSVGNDPCYLLFDRETNTVMTADYSGGSVSVFGVHDDGAVGDRIQCLEFEGSGPVAGRQAASHIHQLKFLDAPDGDRYLLATDLGADRIRVMKVRKTAQDGMTVMAPLEYLPELDIECGPGSGPRHIAVDTLKNRIYCITELSGELLVFGYSFDADGTLSVSLPDRILADRTGASGSADIHIHPTGKFIYTSHRLENDGICVFTVDGDGTVSRTGYCNTGKHPRNFVITPDGKYILVACRDDRTVEIYGIDSGTGDLSKAGKLLTLESDMPSCIVIAE